MTNEQIVKKLVREYGRNYSLDYDTSADVFNFLGNANITSFDVQDTSQDMDNYNQCSYYSKKLSKAIIWDYDYYDTFKNFEDLVTQALKTQKEIDEFESRIILKGGQK